MHAPRSSSSVRFRSISAAIAIFLTAGAWPSAFPLIHIGLSGLKPLQLAAARFGLAAAIVLAWLVAFRPKLPAPRDAGLAIAGVALVNLRRKLETVVPRPATNAAT